VQRRWFQDDFFDLFVWTNTDGEVQQFQLCYDRLRHERVVAWSAQEGMTHHLVDSGETSPLRNDAPMLRAAATLDAFSLSQEFAERAQLLPTLLRSQLLRHLATATEAE